MPGATVESSPCSQRLSRRAYLAGGEPITNAIMARTLAQPELVSLAAGFVDHETLPIEPTRRALAALWAEPGRARAALQYGTTIGHAPLRQMILQRMLDADGRTARELRLSADQIVLTAGSNQLLHMVSDALLDPGDIVLCGAPSYFVYLGTLSSLGARAYGVEIDEQGVIPAALEDELRRLQAAGELGRVKAIYVTTSFDNPSGVSVPAARRAAIVEIAKRWSQSGKIYVIEDAAYRELRYYGDDIASMRSFDAEGDTVVCAGTFSKSFSPGVRVGWGILPPALLEPVLAAKGHIDFGSPNFNQLLMAAVIELGLYEAHVQQLRENYRAKIDAILAALDEHLGPIEGVRWVRPGGGLYVWLQLPAHVDTGLTGPLFNRAVQEGVLYIPGEYCYAPYGRPRRTNMLRLSFGIQSGAGIVRGVAALGRAVRQVLDR